MMFTVKTIVERTIATHLTKEEVLKLIKEQKKDKMYVISEKDGRICGFIDHDAVKD